MKQADQPKETDGRKFAFLLYKMALDILESDEYEIIDKIIYRIIHCNKQNFKSEDGYILREPRQGSIKHPAKKGLCRDYGICDPNSFIIYIDMDYCENEEDATKTLLHESLEVMFSEWDGGYKNDNVWGENKDIMDDFEPLIWKHLTKKEKDYLKEFLPGTQKKHHKK